MFVSSLLASNIRLVLFLLLIGFAFFFCFFLSFRETKNFIWFNKKHIVSLYLQIFVAKELNSFQNLSLEFILKIFLKFRKFQPRYSYETYSYNIEPI